MVVTVVVYVGIVLRFRVGDQFIIIISEISIFNVRRGAWYVCISLSLYPLLRS